MLREVFAEGFDRSRLEALLTQSAAELSARHDLLGQGMHFTAWRVRGAQIVVKRASPGFADAGSPARRQWVAALAAARGAGGLVPPFELLSAGDQLGLAMPYGDTPLAAAAPHWQPLTNRLAELAETLAARGLELGDVAQGRCWRGIPFVFDLSDLRPLTRPRR